MAAGDFGEKGVSHVCAARPLRVPLIFVCENNQYAVILPRIHHLPVSTSIHTFEIWADLRYRDSEEAARGAPATSPLSATS